METQDDGPLRFYRLRRVLTFAWIARTLCRPSCEVFRLQALCKPETTRDNLQTGCTNMPRGSSVIIVRDMPVGALFAACGGSDRRVRCRLFNHAPSVRSSKKCDNSKDQVASPVVAGRIDNATAP